MRYCTSRFCCCPHAAEAPAAAARDWPTAEGLWSSLDPALAGDLRMYVLISYVPLYKVIVPYSGKHGPCQAGEVTCWQPSGRGVADGRIALPHSATNEGAKTQSLAGQRRMRPPILNCLGSKRIGLDCDELEVQVSTRGAGDWLVLLKGVLRVSRVLLLNTRGSSKVVSCLPFSKSRWARMLASCTSSCL